MEGLEDQAENFGFLDFSYGLNLLTNKLHNFHMGLSYSLEK